MATTKWFWDGNSAKIYLWTDRFSCSNGQQFLFERISQVVRTDDNFFQWIAQAIWMDDTFLLNGWPKPFKRMTIGFEWRPRAVQTDIKTVRKRQTVRNIFGWEATPRDWQNKTCLLCSLILIFISSLTFVEFYMTYTFANKLWSVIRAYWNPW